MTAPSLRSASFAAFWPRYLAAHARPATRALHYAGTAIGVAFVLAGIAAGSLAYVALGCASAYALAWTGHLLFERNRPATFAHPFWSVLADFKMLWLALAGRLAAEYLRLAVR